ncbi:amino acid transporter [Propionigenium maris DSM 9537]|uniref:Amino acid transporter n=1 Tax=Propionigenium maris DSM 9537 TaxID=1123000 RepID=A0A9W6GMN6_9FUSO|nr:amino acid permease [Propionigenium maris]GLI56745.1 amino acid transporter [Propionigenium maris DSM 9537]
MSLKKDLTFFDVFSIATGAMISSGIFILPGIAFSYAGPAVFISYFLAGIFALIGILSVAELSTAMPKAGGDYYYISRTLGPMIGTVAGFLSWFALSLKSAFAIFGIAEVIYITTGLNLLLTSLGVCLFFVVLNIVGVKGVAKLEVMLVVGLLALMVIYILFGAFSVDRGAFVPLLPENPNTILITSGFIFISFGGLLNISSIAEEVKDPQKTVPLAMLSSIFVITVIYTLMLIVTVGVLPAEELSGSLTPIADASRRFMGGFGYLAITVAAMFAFVTTALAGIMAASRYPMALSRDSLLPSFISRINNRLHTPVTSIVFTGIFIGVSLFFPLEVLVKIASTVVLTSYVLTNLSVIILRESKILNYQPSFKSPLYPLPQIVSIFIFTFFIADLGLEAAEISISMLLLSLGVYFFYGKKRTEQEYALLHIVEKILDKDLTTHNLETELKEIIKARDEIGTDEFDDLVERARVIDINGTIELQELIERISQELEVMTGQDKKTTYEILSNKERESTSVVSDFVAIPHVILEGSSEFNLLMVRCQEGIRFSDEAPMVKAIFVFSGMKENVLFHLKALASIAYIIQEKHFKTQWIKAKNENYLKDVLLLSRRKRF